MSRTYLTDLVERGIVAGRNATPQDYQDALRGLAELAVFASVEELPLLNALCSLGMRALLRADKRTAIPY